MRLAAIADIHGNALALEAVLDDIGAQRVDMIVNLGDSLSGPLEAARTADILMALDAVTVRGNHDRYLLEQRPSDMHEWESDAFSQLNRRHLDWLAAQPATRVVAGTIFLCHATPEDDNRYWLEQVTSTGEVLQKPLDEIAALADGLDHPLILCGHSHLARAVRLTDGRLIVNPGSVGCPAYDDVMPFAHRMEAGSPNARYAIIEIDGTDQAVEFRSVSYDHETMAKMAAACGRADWEQALRHGRLSG